MFQNFNTKVETAIFGRGVWGRCSRSVKGASVDFDCQVVTAAAVTVPGPVGVGFSKGNPRRGLR
jgi:hypothetical protein